MSEEELELFKSLPPPVVKDSMRDRQRSAASRQRELNREINAAKPCFLKEGDIVKTDFAAPRKCTYRILKVWPAECHCQSGWLANAELINTTGDKENDLRINMQMRGLDIAWFKLQTAELF